jgi:precorrin-2 dehydrogenase/sirohydrochlorin ferrochelatase
MPDYYPIFVDLRGKRTVVVGGGVVAQRKIESLLEYGAVVTLISPEATPRLQEMAADGVICWLRRPYRPGDLEGAIIVVGATISKEANTLISAEANERGVLVNIVDDPELCSFIVPSVLSRGSLLVAVSTQGRSPSLAQMVRRRLEEAIGPEYGLMADLMGRLRPEVLRMGASEAERASIWKRVLASRAMELLREGRIEEAEEEARACLSR